MFEVSISTIANEIDVMHNKMWDTYPGNVHWPSDNEWGNWPDTVAAIDGNSHAIYRPYTEPQIMF